MNSRGGASSLEHPHKTLPPPSTWQARSRLNPPEAFGGLIGGATRTQHEIARGRRAASGLV